MDRQLSVSFHPEEDSDEGNLAAPTGHSERSWEDRIAENRVVVCRSLCEPVTSVLVPIEAIGLHFAPHSRRSRSRSLSRGLPSRSLPGRGDSRARSRQRKREQLSFDSEGEGEDKRPRTDLSPPLAMATPVKTKPAPIPVLRVVERDDLEQAPLPPLPQRKSRRTSPSIIRESESARSPQGL